MAEAQAMRAQTGAPLFRALNLVLIPYLEEVADQMTAIQRHGLTVASGYWRDGTRTIDELDGAAQELADALHRIDRFGCITGFEAHVSSAVLTVMASTFDDGMGEISDCMDRAEWFPKLMWDWCDLTVEECGCLGRCLEMAIHAKLFGAPDRRYAARGASMLCHGIEPGAGIDINTFRVTVPIGSLTERPVEFGDLSLIGTAVNHVAEKYDDVTAATRTKTTQAAWIRLKTLFTTSEE